MLYTRCRSRILYLLFIASVAASPTFAAKPKSKNRVAAVETVESRILAAMGKPVELYFDKSSIADVAVQLRETAKIPVDIDATAIDLATATGKPIVNFETKDTPLATALDLMLGPLDLSWTMHQGTLLITSKKDLDRYLSTRVYDVSDLVCCGDETSTTLAIEQLMEVFTGTVEPTSWEQVGGKGSITHFQSAQVKAVIVSQEWRVHRSIEELLAALRKIAKPAKQDRQHQPASEAPNPDTNAVQPKGRTVVTLGVDDEVRIDYASSGCFHFVDYEYTISGKSPRTVSVVELEYNAKAIEHHSLGAVTLSQLDLKRLDNSLNYYRLKKQGQCTTVETIRVSWLHKGEVVQKEVFQDATCELPRDTLPLSTLAERTKAHSPLRKPPETSEATK